MLAFHCILASHTRTFFLPLLTLHGFSPPQLRSPQDAKVSSTLLALGFSLLHLLSTSKTQQELTAGLKLLARLIPRPEFDILQPMTTSGLYRWSPDQQKKARQYRSLLIKVHILIASNMAEFPVVEANGSLLSLNQSLSLYPRLLAVLYWRLPYVGVLIRKAVGLDLMSVSNLEDFSERPELPSPPSAPSATTAKPTAIAPKRGRVKADSKAPPPMNLAMLTNATSSSSSGPNSAISQRSSSEGARTAVPMAPVIRPHSASFRQNTPPTLDLGELTIDTSKKDPSSPSSDSQTSPDASAPTTPTSEGSDAPCPAETISGLEVTPSVATADQTSTDTANTSNTATTTEGLSSETRVPNSTSPPPEPEPVVAPSSSELLLLQASRLSPPPSSGSPPILETPLAPNSTSAPPPSPGDSLPAPAKSNPKMSRRPAVNNVAPNATTPSSSPAPAKPGSSSPTFSFKVSVPSTIIELDDELMELMILPKTGEVPYYREFDASLPINKNVPISIPWNSWMRVCKKMGYIASNGQFVSTPPPPSSMSTPVKKKKSHSPSPSSGSHHHHHHHQRSDSSLPPAPSIPGEKILPASVIAEPKAALGERCLLYNWVNFHQTLVEMGPEAHTSPGCIPSPAYFVEQEPRSQWLIWFENGRSILFVLFFKEWIHHTTHMLSRTNELFGLNWATIPGYKQMEMTLQAIYKPVLAQRMSMPLIDASRPLSRCSPELVSWLVKWCFNQTNAHSTDSVNAMFSKLEMWFSELDRNLLRLPASFDSDYFLQGLDVIINIDHHVILARLLSFLFTYAHLLRGKVRRAVIEEFLIKKHFFTLFLHWDDVVRNYYQQFLIYKTVRIRKLAHVRHGLVSPTPEALTAAKELAAVNHSVPVNRRSMYGSITTQAAVANTGFGNASSGTSSSTGTGTANVPNPHSVHGLPMLPRATESFTAGTDAEGFLVDPQDEEYLQDMRLFTISESLVRIVEDQITQGGKHLPLGPESQTAYPKSLEIYAPRSLSEYNFYLSRYEQKYMCAKLIPMSIIQEKRNVMPKSSRPKNSD